MTPSQCKAARKRLNWTKGLLSLLTNIESSTIDSFESGECTLSKADESQILSAFSGAGVDPRTL